MNLYILNTLKMCHQRIPLDGTHLLLRCGFVREPQNTPHV